MTRKQIQKVIFTQKPVLNVNISGIQRYIRLRFNLTNSINMH